MLNKLPLLLLILVLSFSLSSCGGETPSSFESSESPTVPPDAVPMEADLGDLGKLSFLVPKMFGDHLEAAVLEVPEHEDGYIQKIQLLIKDGSKEPAALEMVVMKQTLRDQWIAEGNWVPPHEILDNDGYILGYWNYQENPFEEGTTEYELMQHYSELTSCIVASISWTK